MPLEKSYKNRVYIVDAGALLVATQAPTMAQPRP
jgi:hypothetical protein